MARILVIGGSGATGKLVISEALEKGYTITALVRNPSSLLVQSGLEIVKGSPTILTDVEAAFEIVPDDCPVAVIVTLASSKVEGSRIIADSVENLITVMKKHKVSRIVVMSSFGTGSSLEYISPIMRYAIKNTGMQHSYADHDMVDRKVKESGLEYVMPRPSRLTAGAKAPITLHGDNGDGMGIFAGLGGISRMSVANFLVDAVGIDTWRNSTPVISN